MAVGTAPVELRLPIKNRLCHLLPGSRIDGIQPLCKDRMKLMPPLGNGTLLPFPETELLVVLQQAQHTYQPMHVKPEVRTTCQRVAGQMQMQFMYHRR